MASNTTGRVPCPFCGSSAVIRPERTAVSVRLMCGECGARGPIVSIGRDGNGADALVAFAGEMWDRRK